MTKEFIPYEEALALKELGFNESCLSMSEHKKQCSEKAANNGICTLHNLHCGYPNCEIDKTITPIPLPLYQQAFRWFRNKYKKQAEILWAGDMDYFVYKIGNFKYADYIFSDREFKAYFETYEDAELACLRKLIELVKKEA